MAFSFNSILPTAFMGTAMIFTCFTLSALYARRRSYLFLGGMYELENRERISALAKILPGTLSLPPTCNCWVENESLCFGGKSKEWL